VDFVKLSSTIRLRAAGTSEGVKKAWDTRGRSGKTKTTKPTPKQVKQAVGLYAALGVAITTAHHKLEHPEEVKSIAGKFFHLLKSVGTWIEAGSALAGIHSAISSVVHSGTSHLVLDTLSWAHQQMLPIMGHLASSMNFSAEEIEAASQFGNTGWQYGRSIARSVGYVPSRTTAGFPTSHGGTGAVHRGRHGGTGTVRRPSMPKAHAPKGPSVHRPNPSGHAGFNVRKPNLSVHRLGHHLESYGTSEGVKKEWDERGRGKKREPQTTRDLRPGDYLRIGNTIWPWKVEKVDEAGVHIVELIPRSMVSNAGVVPHRTLSDVKYPITLLTKAKDVERARATEEAQNKWSKALSPVLGLNKIKGEKTKVKQVKADIGGEPMTGNMGHAHIDPVTWFHPPSLLKRNSNESLRIPTDDPGESKDSFMDKTQRDDPKTQEFRMKILKRSAPGGLPSQIPARTTLLSPHSASYMPSGVTALYGASVVRKNGIVVRRKKGIMFTSYARRGCI
jgi:hypothetical protein